MKTRHFEVSGSVVGAVGAALIIATLFIVARPVPTVEAGTQRWFRSPAIANVTALISSGGADVAYTFPDGTHRFCISNQKLTVATRYSWVEAECETDPLVVTDLCRVIPATGNYCVGSGEGGVDVGNSIIYLMSDGAAAVVTIESWTKNR